MTLAWQLMLPSFLTKSKKSKTPSVMIALGKAAKATPVRVFKLLSRRILNQNDKALRNVRLVRKICTTSTCSRLQMTRK
jgi:hypothetical protein